MFGDDGLQNDRRSRRVDAGCQPVSQHVQDIALNDLWLGVAGRQHMQVRHQEEALVCIL
jgi:hypothetical protein